MLNRFREYKQNRHWKKLARQAEDRKRKLTSFGQKAFGVLVDGKHGLFVVNPEDGVVSRRLLYTGVYSEPELVLAQSLVPDGGKVLVVGAHVGALTVPLSRKCSKLIAIEANPETFRYLQANLLLSQCDNVTAHNVAAGDGPGKIQFIMSRENSGGSKRMPVRMNPTYIIDKPQIVEIETVALDTFVEDQDFDLVLMDIEGSEYFALKGMPQILKQAKTLSVEFLVHHLRNVAAVSVAEFLRPILPHFEWMYVPENQRLVVKVDIPEAVEKMYQADESHDGILFLKDPLPGWLISNK